ncbi:MAG TPA: porin family protein [Agriterribacter sp.]|nr:porin family protein [Agriterribacter sp.]
MKQVILTVFAVIALGLVSKAQFRVGVKAGGNLSNQQISVPSGSLYTGKDVAGYHVGVLSEFMIARNVYLQPQLLFTRKGASLFQSTEKGMAKLRINYLELPVTVLYKVQLPFGKIFGGAGAAFSYAISGSQSQDGNTTNIFSGTQHWQREDISLCFTAGMEFNNGIFISMNSEKGLMNVYQTDGITAKNKSRSVTVGYTIDWNKLKGKG